MARPREFDQEAVLDRAMELFWTRGYERTSIQDLVEHTGVHRGSLYDTFGDKNQLFLTCLDRFRQHSKPLFRILDEPGSPKEVLERFFDKLIEHAMTDEKRGCMIANTAMDLGAVEPAIAMRIEAYTLDIETIFYTFLLRAQKDGKIKSRHSLRELSRFLVNTRHGLYVMAKTAADRKPLQDACKVALSIMV
ncbi:TetR/AcrR family transcriptional regulator [Cohnella cellulosilytica]